MDTPNPRSEKPFPKARQKPCPGRGDNCRILTQEASDMDAELRPAISPLPNGEHLAALREGLDGWNRWRRDHPGSAPDLIRANLIAAGLREADLCRANLTSADLREADLREADLRKATLTAADLRAADLREADMRGADLSSAKLRGADLSRVDLRGANLSWADFHSANLTDAKLEGAILSGANFSEALGLLQAQVDAAQGHDLAMLPRGIRTPRC